MSAPLFSIILPTFNRARMARTAIETVLYQTCGDWECFVIDDGSTDGTQDMLRAYAGDPRIRIVTAPVNQGMNASRNRAIGEVSGRYITFLDSDDLWLPERLSSFQQLLERRPEAEFLFSNARVLRDGRLMGTLFDPARTIPEGVVPGHYALGDQHLPYVTTNVVISAAAFRRWGLFRTETKTLDTELFTRFLGRGLPVAVLREPLSVRRLHGEQLTDRYRENFTEAMEALDSSGASASERRRIRVQAAEDVALYLVKACRPAEARAFLREALGASRARTAAAWAFSFLPVPLLRLLRRGRRIWLRLRHHPALATMEERAVYELITPLLLAEN